jgi:long-chain acyl-CoA synthetase
VAVSVNNTFTAEEISAILADSGARAVVVGDGYDHRLDGIRQILPTLEQVVVAGVSSPPMGTRTWRQFLGGAGDQPPGQPTGTDAGGDDLALLSYTSGTTGKPKGVCLSHANLLANHAQMASTRLRLEADDVVLCVLPLFHIYALNVALAFTIARGAAVVLAERFDPLQTLAVIAEHRVSVIVGAPPMYTAWLNTPAAGAGDLASVRYAVSGAAPLARPVLERFRDELGLEIWEGYGLTETAPVLTSAAVCDRLVAGSAGRPLPGWRCAWLTARAATYNRVTPARWSYAAPTFSPATGSSPTPPGRSSTLRDGSARATSASTRAVTCFWSTARPTSSSSAASTCTPRTSRRFCSAIRRWPRPP